MSQSMEHFVRLARRGKSGTRASAGEERARRLALAILHHAPGIDAQGLEGAAEFLVRAAMAPELARQLVGAE